MEGRAPPQIDVTLTGALLAVEKAKAALAPVVRLSASDTKAREAAVSIEGLPPGVGVRISPERVKVSPVEADVHQALRADPVTDWTGHVLRTVRDEQRVLCSAPTECAASPTSSR